MTLEPTNVTLDSTGGGNNWLNVIMPILICKCVWFYSAGDERAFFDFAGGIKGVRKIGGVGDDIHLSVSSRLSEASLREVLGLFYRYKIEMRQLSQFLTPQNDKWFRDKRAYWYGKVFGSGG